MASEICPLAEKDVSLFLELTQAFYAHEGFDFDACASGRMARQLLADPALGAVFLAKDGCRPVGYMVLTHCFSFEFGGPFVLLDEIFVVPEVRKAGLGKRLIDCASAYCRQRGINYLRLEVQQNHARAIEVYRAYGFRTETRYLMSLPTA